MVLKEVVLAWQMERVGDLTWVDLMLSIWERLIIGALSGVEHIRAIASAGMG